MISLDILTLFRAPSICSSPLGSKPAALEEAPPIAGKAERPKCPDEDPATWPYGTPVGVGTGKCVLEAGSYGTPLGACIYNWWRRWARAARATCGARGSTRSRSYHPD